MPHSFISDTTLWVKTCWRPAKVVRLVASARAAYPDLRIIVADDAAESGQADQRALELAGADDVLVYGEDAGRPHCWNAAIRDISTVYTMLCDDDELFLGTDLAPWGEFLDPGERTLVAGAVVNRDGSLASTYIGRFWRVEHDEANQAELYCSHYESAPTEPWDCDYAPNFWIAPTWALRLAPWDEELKACAHADTFIRFQEAGFRVVYDPRVKIVHVASEPPEDPPEYRALRTGRYPEYRKLFESKRGLREGGFHD